MLQGALFNSTKKNTKISKRGQMILHFLGKFKKTPESLEFTEN